MNNNGLRTVFLMTLVAVLVMFVGQLVAGTTGIIIAFVVAMGINFYSYWKSDEMVLKMYDAQPVSGSWLLPCSASKKRPNRYR